LLLAKSHRTFILSGNDWCSGQAINFIDTHKHDDLTPKLILELHKIVTDNTIDNPDDEGMFRRDDDIRSVLGH
jgi:hypothetical protein